MTSLARIPAGNYGAPIVLACAALLSSHPALAQLSQQGPNLAQEVPLPEGRRAAPVPSPDGRFLAFTGEDYRGLKLLDLETGQIRTLSHAEGAGFHASWSEGSHSIAFRTSSGAPTPKLRIVVAHPDGVTETASRLEDSLSLPVWRGDRLFFMTFRGGKATLKRAGPKPAGPETPPPLVSPDGRIWLGFEDSDAVEAVTPIGKIYSIAVLSPDGRQFVAECLDGHLYLGSGQDGKLEDLGVGSYPSFVRNGSALLFERASDNGQTLTPSGIFLMDLKTREVRAVTATPNCLDRRPQMSGDGHTIFYEEGGRIFTGWAP